MPKVAHSNAWRALIKTFPALMRDNVELVTGRIAAIEPGEIRLQDEKLRPLDVLVLATGFRGDNFILPAYSCEAEQPFLLNVNT